MAKHKTKKNFTRGPRVSPENLKTTIGFTIERKYVDTPEKVIALRTAIYSAMDVYKENNCKIF